MSLNNFNFNSTNLSPTSLNFYFVSSQLYQIYTDTNYIYAATNIELKIYDINTENLYAYIPYNDGFTTVAGNGGYIYLGTTSSGIKRISKACISGSVLTPYNLSTCLSDYVTSPYIDGDDIQYLHANDNFMGVISNAGLSVSIAKFAPQSYMSATTLSFRQAAKCFITNTGSLYYTSSGTSDCSIDVVIKSLVDWVEPSYSYTTGSGILKANIQINDIFITENTSGNNNTLFVATSSGLYIINESTNEFAIYLEE